MAGVFNKLIAANARYVRAHSTAQAKLEEVVSARLREIEAAGTWKSERVITSPQTTEVTVRESPRPVLNFCANNYLGLANHPEVVSAAETALRDYGAGLSSVRFICGTQTIHKELEHDLSKFHSREDTILYGSCFDANAGLFEALLTPEDAVFSDALNHASIIDGIRLCKAQKFRYKHRDMKELDAMLSSSAARLKLVVTDGVFSMDGTVAPLADLVALAERHEALLAVDECHATGFFGETGRGTEEYCSVLGRVDIIQSTLGKALGGAAGGYTSAARPLVQLLRNVSRPYLFSNAPPPAVVASARKALEIAESYSGLRERLFENTRLFREGMRDAGFEVRGEEHPICPVMVGEAALAARLATGMLEKGVYVTAFSYPVVAAGQARVRVQLSAAHTEGQVRHAVRAFAEVAGPLGIV